MLNKAIIDLNALRKNALAVRKKLKKGVLFNAVVKADAYGHGAPAVANALYKAADCFSVAIVEEAVELRRAGIDKDILVLNPIFLSDLSRAVYFGLTLTVQRTLDVDMLEAEGFRQGREVKVHVKFNTGMNRMGADGLNGLNKILLRIKECKFVRLDGMFSHFARPQNKKSLNLAEKKFLLANNLVKGYNNKAVCHISASGGFLSGVQADMVRIGILLYGYKPFESDYVSVKPVMKIYAPIVLNRRIPAGGHAFYGDKISNRTADISIIRYGYADGLFREEVSGQFNDRCMDVTAVNKIRTGKFGYPVMTDADRIAKAYRTISYEVLTKSALRAEKIYLN